MNYLINGETQLEASSGFRCVGRSKELKEMASILTRKHANSIILTGPGGVGCSTLCLGLQAWKTDKENPAPFDIASKRVFWLDTDGLFSSGDSKTVNEEFKKIVSALAATSDSILVIEDVGDFINACKSGGYDHFINAVMNMVKTRESQVIFEVKDESFDGVVKSHSDMIELFTVLEIGEPDPATLKLIVADTGEALAKYHHIGIEESAIDAVIALTTKYRAAMTRAQPTRSVNLLDRAMATFRMTAHEKIDESDKVALAKYTAELRRLEDVRIALDEEMRIEEARIDEAANTQAKSVSKFTKMVGGSAIDTTAKAAIRNKIEFVEGNIQVQTRYYNDCVARVNENIKITKAEVTAEFARISGIPAEKLNEDEREKLRNLEATLKTRIYGQDFAVKHVADMVKTSRIGRRTGGKPMGACLLAGPSGVGKTEMAKALAAAMFGDEKSLFRLDMSEYMEKHAVAKLIGAPPGYEGFEAGGILTNGIRKQPVCILLLDEIEKAHPDVFNIFLQILGDGRLTDNVGRVVSFEDVYVICTTNLGQEHFLNPKLTPEQAQKKMMEELDKTYRPEFLNRFGGRKDIIGFSALGVDIIERIVDREIGNIKYAYLPENIQLLAGPEEIGKFCKKNYDPRTGARGLPGHLRSTLEPMIADAALAKKQDDALQLNIVYNAKSFNLVVEK